LFDTLIVRAFMTPSIAALLGRWFWWPQIVRPRPASPLLRAYGPRPVVRSLLLHEDESRQDESSQDESRDEDVDDAVTVELPRPSV
jgi:putative drug exporter of the RND superfamily